MIAPDDAARIEAYTFTKPEGLLAHYTEAAVAFEHILRSRRLRLSPYRLMRDPAENKDIRPNIEWLGLGSDVDDAIDAVYSEIKATRDRMRVLSLTHDTGSSGGSYAAAYDCCWARPRMWEQYGDDHRGACLLFDRPLLDAAVREAWPGEHTIVRDVGYARDGSGEATRRILQDQRLFDDELRPAAVADYIADNVDAFFFLKSDDFATEYERRVVLAEVDDDYACFDFGASLAGVVIGERFPQSERQAAIADCSDVGVKLGWMHWSDGRPHVLRVP